MIAPTLLVSRNPPSSTLVLLGLRLEGAVKALSAEALKAVGAGRLRKLRRFLGGSESLLRPRLRELAELTLTSVGFEAAIKIPIAS